MSNWIIADDILLNVETGSTIVIKKHPSNDSYQLYFGFKDNNHLCIKSYQTIEDAKTVLNTIRDQLIPINNLKRQTT